MNDSELNTHERYSTFWQFCSPLATRSISLAPMLQSINLPHVKQCNSRRVTIWRC